MKHLERRARILQRKFDIFDKANGFQGTGNSAYIVAQAKDYRRSVIVLSGQEGRAHARSEMSRILALALRECLRQGWDFEEVMQEGLQYEWEIADERGPESSKIRPGEGTC